MLINGHLHKEDGSSSSRSQHPSAQSSSQLSPSHHPYSNASNQVFQEQYSFHNLKSHSPDNGYPDSKVGTQRIGAAFQRKCNSELTRRYQQIYNKLQLTNRSDVIYLFLEELHQNEKYRQRICQFQLNTRRMQLQIGELKDLLQSKRAAIRKLCQTQTNNINLIECLQLQGKCMLNFDSHYKTKYQQLQACMNEYMSNTKQAQEEFIRSYKVLKADNLQLSHRNERIQREAKSNKKLLKLAQINLAKCLDQVGAFQQEQKELKSHLQQLQKKNASLNQKVKQLQQSIRGSHQQFCNNARQKGQISSSLDFIHEKNNCDRFLSQVKDIQTIIRQRQQLLELLGNIVANSQCIAQEKQQRQAQQKQILQSLESKTRMLKALQQQVTIFHGHQGSVLNHSLSSKIKYVRRGEFSRIDPNCFADSSSLPERLDICSNSKQYSELH